MKEIRNADKDGNIFQEKWTAVLFAENDLGCQCNNRIISC